MKYVILSILTIIIAIGVYLSVRVLRGRTVDIQKTVDKSLSDTIPLNWDSSLINHSKIPDTIITYERSLVLVFTDERGCTDTLIGVIKHGQKFTIDVMAVKQECPHEIDIQDNHGVINIKQ